MTDESSSELTFLFTDIEGSTSLWEHHAGAMGLALARHDRLLQQQIELHGGTVFKTVGDAFYAVFPSALAALLAALGAQRQIQAELWGVIGSLRVRMAIHSGAAEERQADYFGPTLNRLARLLAVAHGGQTLISGPAQQQLSVPLPDQLGLRDLGQHFLRDLIQPEQIYQAVGPGLPDDFPPLVSKIVTPHNLPTQVTSFIGREQSINTSIRELANTHLLTLTGPGGTGKTRLALQVAERVLSQFPAGVWFVELAPISDQTLIPQAIAAAVEIRESQDRPLLEALLAYFQPKQALIILDNCEHVIAGCAEIATTVLRHCPAVRILATSREALNIAGETTRQVPSLDLPDQQQLSDLEALGATEAVRLLLDRVHAVQQQFVLTAENAAAVAAICQRLDGIPLALELVAARFKVLTVDQIVVRLADRFKLLTGGNRAALPRQQTLRALIDWSHELLKAQEQTVLRRLVVFAGGWNLEAAELVVADGPIAEIDVLDTLTNLVQKSLVVMDEQRGSARYRMLETIRQYGGERLNEAGEAELFARRHAHWCLSLAEQADINLRTAQQPIWVIRLEQEHDNMRAALEWSLRQRDEPDLAAQLASALAWFWQVHGYLSEGRRWLAAALSRPHLMPAVQAKALARAGMLAFSQSDGVTTVELLEQSLAIFQALGNRWELALTQAYLGRTYQVVYEPQRAIVALEASLAIFRELGDPWALAWTMTAYGEVLREQNKLAEAQLMLEEALVLGRTVGEFATVSWTIQGLAYTLARREMNAQAISLYEEGLQLAWLSGNKVTQGHFLNYLGEGARLMGDYQRAEELYAASMALFREMNIPTLMAMLYLNQGQLARLMGRKQQAHELLQTALGLAYKNKQKRFVCATLNALAGLAVSLGDYQRAVRLFGSLEALLEEFEFHLDPADRPLYEQDTATARQHADSASWNAAWEAGQALTYDEVVAYALSAEPDI